jgi:hypothetical protein
MYENDPLPPLDDLPPGSYEQESLMPHIGEGNAYSPVEPPTASQDLEGSGIRGDPAAPPPARPAAPVGGPWNRVPVGNISGGLPRAARWVWYVFWVVETLIAIRVVLKLLAANPQAFFTSFVYDITWPFVAVFTNVFPSPAGDDHVVDAAAILALFIYPLVAWAITELIVLRHRRRNAV